jgi:hypothetical protein
MQVSPTDQKYKVKVKLSLWLTKRQATKTYERVEDTCYIKRNNAELYQH